jgi:iron complex outermembrane receptor protein
MLGAGSAGSSFAQDGAPVSVQARPTLETDGKVQQVNVSGARADDTETRRLSTASRIVVGREELERNGDTSLGEVLKRLPGVTMSGPAGSGGSAQMRGLGNGYTQMLLNGERPPPGFSLESIPPSQVERIEVMRGPVAEHSTQAIAGTINVILREGVRQKDTQLRIADNITYGRHNANVSVTMPGKTGNLSWLLNATASENRPHTEVTARDADLLPDGGVQRLQLIRSVGDGRSRALNLAPRLSWKFGSGDTLNVQPFVSASRNLSTNDAPVDQLVGIDPPDFVLQHAVSHTSGTMARVLSDWTHKMADGAKLEVKLSAGVNRSDSEGLRYNYGPEGRLNRLLSDIDSDRQRSLTSSGKYGRPLGEGHHVAAGWEAEAGHLAEVHVAEADGKPLYAASGADLSADTRRLALFAQDEWDIGSQWSGYLGLRWEGIRTTSDTPGKAVKNSSSVWSPVLHAVYRIPGAKRDQVRASLTRSYKAPVLDDLIAAPSFVSDNHPTRPDRSGNPDLKPELATGLDLAYEHYLSKSGILSANAFVREIDDLMRRRTSLQATSIGPRWVSTPSNVGHARTSGIELEAKFQLAELHAGAPDLDVRTNYSRFWSQVDGIPGPYNRLDQQAKQTANLGLDYRMKGAPLTLGGNLNWTPLTLVRTSTTELVTTGMKRQLDLYGLWKFSADTQLRVSGNNLLPRQAESARVVEIPGLVQALETWRRTYATVGIRLETKI